MSVADRPLDEQLQAALDAAEDETARYHIRQALQLWLIEQERLDGELSAD